MTQIEMLDAAVALAVEAHSGQVDKAGAPYILHPLRVMNAVLARWNDYNLAAAAVLHDAVENSQITLTGLIAEGMSRRVVTTVGILTRQDGVTYANHIKDISASPDATAVKIEDIRDNMDITRFLELKKENASLLLRYHKAFAELEKAMYAFMVA